MDRILSFGQRLVMGLIGRAWTAASRLLGNMAELRTDGGHVLVIAALAKLADKVEEADTQQATSAPTPPTRLPRCTTQK